jgi:hypothetical protein
MFFRFDGENYLKLDCFDSVMVDSSEEKLLQCMLEFKSRITPREMLVLNDFHKRFSTTLRHRELILELIELSQKVRKLADKGKFSQEYSEDFKRIFENLNREVFSKFANILGQEVVCINDEVRLISSSKVATKREVEILRYDYGELNKSISSGLSSNAVRARKI